MKKMLFALIAVVLLNLPVIAGVLDDNIIANPGFEGKGKAEWINYDFGPQYGRDYNATDQKHDGKQSLKLWATQKFNDPNKWEMSGAKQIFPIQPGDIISGGAWLKWENLKDTEAFVECKWLDANKKELGSGIGTEHKSSGTGGWEYQDLTKWSDEERTAPEGTAYVDFRLTLVSSGNADTATGIVWWDDAQFTIEKGR